MATKVKQVSLPKRLKAMKIWEMVEIKASQISEYRSIYLPFSKQEQTAGNGSLIITRTA